MVTNLLQVVAKSHHIVLKENDIANTILDKLSEYKSE